MRSLPGPVLRVKIAGSALLRPIACPEKGSWRRSGKPLPGHRLLAVLAALTAGIPAAQGQTAAPQSVPQAAPAASTPPANAPTGSAPAAAAPAKEMVERLNLETSDGVQLSAWYYPVPRSGPSATDASAPNQAAVKPAATETAAAPVVILLHDLDGSHLSVERLAKSLQHRGVAVVAPDLRGHGESVGRRATAGGADSVEARSLKKNDFEMITRTRGGQMRDQSAIRGDIECVRNWIKQQADAGRLDMQRLFVVGSGVGATLAASWAVEDAAWPDLATGPQGRQVRGLVLVSPVWTVRGFSLSPALASELIRKVVPVIVIAGADDRDAVKIFDQLKRQRPEGWFEKLADQAKPTPNPKRSQDSQPESLFLLQLDTALGGDRLASYRSADARRNSLDPDVLVEGFISRIAPPPAGN